MKFLFSRIIFVNQDFIISLEWSPMNNMKLSTQFLELIKIQTSCHIESTQRLNDGSHGEGHMGFAHQGRHEIGAHGSRAETEGRACGWTKNNIGSYAAGAPGALIQRAVADADQRQNHRDFDSNGEHAQECADGTMANVLKDESIQQVNIIGLAGAAAEIRFDASLRTLRPLCNAFVPGSSTAVSGFCSRHVRRH